MFLREIKKTVTRLLPTAPGDRTKFDSSFQFKGYLTSQWGPRVPREIDDGITYYTHKNQIVARWDGFSDSGFVVQKTALKEEALETQDIVDVWAENKDSAAWYMNSTQYQVRQIKGTSSEYEAFSIVGDQRKLFGKFTTAELNSTLEPIRAGQKPDAEGFMTYVDPEKVEAFKYQGDPIKVMIDKVGARLNNGDYVVRSNDGNDFTYAIEKPSTFEATLTKAK